MPPKILSLLVITLLGHVAVAAPADPEFAKLIRKSASLEEAEIQAKKLMEAMTPEERFDYVCGTGFGVRAVPRLGIPELRFGDASAGLRIKADLKPGKFPNRTTAFPCTLLLAATWSPATAERYAHAVAEEYRAAGRHFILGPGMNLYRDSKSGRNFEYLGEDPFLASAIVAPYVRGAQGVNVGATIKHFIANETENRRRASNSLVDARTLHEIYLPPFQAGIDAGTWAVMTSYNALNGEWVAQSKAAVTDILRDQLGFKLLVMTDWTSSWHGDRLAASGTDLEMPVGAALKFDRKQVLGSPDIDRMVVSVLKTGIYSGLFELAADGKFAHPEWESKYPAHVEVAAATNREGIVLLKNNGILPLDATVKGKFLVTGNAAMRTELAGGGSGHVIGYDSRTYLEETQRVFGASHVEFVENPTDEQIRKASGVLVFSGRTLKGEGEASNHAFELPEDALIARCAKLNPRTVVTVVCGGGAAMEWADAAAAVVHAMYGGQAGAPALLDILTGKVNPSGKLPFTIERKYADSPTVGDAALVKPATILTDPKDLAKRVDPKKKDFFTNKDRSEFYTYDLPYQEGVFVGYRWYDEKEIAPRFPFGFGLSYTTFAYSDLTVETGGNAKSPSAKVRFTLTNTGKVAGDEVAQVYVGDPESSVPRPKRELKGFARVHLEPGEKKTVEIPLATAAFSFWDPQTKRWTAEPGAFVIDVAASSRDIKLSEQVTF